MIGEILFIVGILGIVLLLWYVLNLRDKVKYLNRLCDRQAQQLIDERRSMHIERDVMKAEVYEAKRSYKRAESKYKL